MRAQRTRSHGRWAVSLGFHCKACSGKQHKAVFDASTQTLARSMPPRGSAAYAMSPSPGKGTVQQSWTRRQQHRLEGTGWQEPSASSTGSWHPLAEVARRAAHRAAFERHQQAPAPMIDLTVYDDEEGGEQTPVPRLPLGLVQQTAWEGHRCGSDVLVHGFDPQGHSVFVHGRPVQVHLQ